MTYAAAADRPRVLVLDEEVPWPADTGKRIRTVNLLGALASSFEIEMLVHANGATDEACTELTRRGIAVHVAPSRIPEKRGPGFLVRLAGNLVGRLPYSVASHTRPGYRRTLRRLLRERDYALVHCEWTPYAVYARELDRPWVVAAHNVESQIWSRMADQERSWPRRRFIRMQAARMHRFERSVFEAARWATAVSEPDAETVRELGCRRVRVVPNGVDTAAYDGDPANGEAHALVFIGSMDWRPNQDAVRWYVEAIQPALGRDDAFKLQVVGRNPPEWLSRLCADAGVELTGTVPDVRPFVERGAIVVVPLRIGGGSRLKILEAFAMRRPVVSTRVGAEGLDVEDGRHLVLADDPESFADAVRRLAGSPETRRKLVDAGRKLVEERYDWRVIARRQAELWREAMR